MSERLVMIAVTKDLRDEIKASKREKTYDQFLRILIKKGNPASEKDTEPASARVGA